MGEVIVFPMPSTVRRISVQVSYYRQDDGTKLFCVEKLLPDGTYDHEGHFRDLADAWNFAGALASEKRWELLSESLWPGCSHLLAL